MGPTVQPRLIFFALAFAPTVATSGCVTEKTVPEDSSRGGAPGGTGTSGSTSTGGTPGTGGFSTGGVAGTSGSSSTVGGTGGSSGAATGGSDTAGASTGGLAGSGGDGGGSGGNGGGGGNGLAGAGSGGVGGQSSGGAAGVSGGGSAGAAPALCPPNASFCEDFEDGNLDGWTKNESGGTLVVNTTRPSHGTRSLEVNVPAMQYGGAIVRSGAPLFPLPNKRMWGRLMIYFGTIADGHTDFIRGAATNGATPQYNVAEQHGEIMLNYYNGSSADCWARPRPGKVVPLGTWMCWEWSFDGAANQMQFYIDGTLSRQVDGTGDGCLTNPTQTWVAPTFAELRIGEYVAERSPAAQHIWIDDIAVGTQSRIACPP